MEADAQERKYVTTYTVDLDRSVCVLFAFNDPTSLIIQSKYVKTEMLLGEEENTKDG